ncbi:ABC transporter substrate-binding protein [Scatolibacter rhodanostii]|uniref:ABC transporter substrate-binding protein n=1 Tax=Scatolibacter rhodanostii TaxID=2014781 RepID=UPI000C06E515|nr:ABC transporter substrate-binding protein [Scatolibacter rhodanostii]
MSTKKLFAALLALMMVVTSLAGCANNKGTSSTESSTPATSETSSKKEVSSEAGTDEEYPTISTMVICGSIPADADKVAEELSKITREKIGVNVEFVMIEVANVATQLNLLLSGGDDTLDVYMAGVSVPYSTVVNNGQALALDDLMKPYEADMKAALGENVYEAGRVDGNLYGIGHLLDQASTAAYNLRADIATEFGYKNGDKVDLAELTELFSKIKAKYPDTPLIGPMNGGPNIGDSRIDQLGNKLGVLEDYGQTTTVTNYYESEGYKELVGYFKQWSEMGAYMPDLLNVADAPVDFIPSGKAFGNFAGHFSAEMNGIWSSQNFGTEIASLQIYDDAVAVTPWGYDCINPASKNPEKAAAYINLMATDSDAVNLIINGIQNEHYTLKDDNTATYVEGKNVSTTGWAMGYSWTALNSTLSYPFEYPTDYYQQLKDANKNAHQSKAFGCQFDLTSVSDAVSACTNVVNQYENALASGSVTDFEGTLAQFQQGLKDAGIDTIIAAKQQQLDAFLASK